LARRLDTLSRDFDEASDTASDLESQGDLFAGRLEALERDVQAARAVLERATERVEEAHVALDAAREAEGEAMGRAQALEARRGALEALEKDREGMEPVVQAALDAGLKGVHGPLVDSVRAGPETARAVEAWLGPFARALVVENVAAAEAARQWFRGTWRGGGGLILLPLDAVPEPGTPGSLLASFEVSGAGAPWLRCLLAGVDLVDDDALLESAGGGGRVTADGSLREPSGAVRVGNPAGASGILVRKGELRALARDAEAAGKEAEEAREARASGQERLRALERERDEARKAFRETEDTLREASAEVAAAVDRKARADRHRDELARQVEGTRAARARALERTAQAREDRQGLVAEEAKLKGRRAEARAAVETVQAEWEEARSEQARLEVQTTRLQGERSRLEERLRSVEQAREASLQRVEALDAEERQLHADLEEARTLQSQGGDATQELFQQREEAQGALRGHDEVLAEVSDALARAEAKARQARQAEREATDRRHRLELERQELEGRIGRIRDRLEGEWGRSLEALFEEARPVEEPPEALENELREIVAALERIGPVNMLAVEEHAEESQRLDFLKGQHGDLVQARDDLRSAIRQINKTATGLFQTTFESIRENFKQVHQRLFEGGEADIWLTDDEDPLESPIEIHASPQGKKTQRIDLLSGGERALTALSLLFSIYLVKPSPFCVLDEVDAPLDENNIGRFIRLLDDFKSQTQFVVITHNPRTIEAADWIYGVTMEEPGVSTIVGVRLQDALEQARGVA
jgi:chromosome segregation protein